MNRINRSLLTFALLTCLFGCDATSPSDLKLINGKKIDASEFPEVVRFFSQYFWSGTGTCSATRVKVTEKWDIYLTSGHCVCHKKDGLAEKVYLKAGDSKIYADKYGYDRDTYNCNETNLDNAAKDVAVLMFERDADEPALPAFEICPFSPKTGDEVVMVGYGINRLRKVEGTYKKRGAGTKRLGYNTVFNVTENLIYVKGAFSATDSSGENASGGNGDSGGPLLMKTQDNSYCIAGVASAVTRSVEENSTTTYYAIPIYEENRPFLNSLELLK